jgi:hypothetical protein
MGLACTSIGILRVFLLINYFHIQGVNPKTKKLEISTTPNQDPLLSHIPIIGVDIWEHAFYLQYKNVKADVSISEHDILPSQAHYQS